MGEGKTLRKALTVGFRDHATSAQLVVFWVPGTHASPKGHRALSRSSGDPLKNCYLPPLSRPGNWGSENRAAHPEAHAWEVTRLRTAGRPQPAAAPLPHRSGAWEPKAGPRGPWETLPELPPRSLDRALGVVGIDTTIQILRSDEPPREEQRGKRGPRTTLHARLPEGEERAAGKGARGPGQATS